MTAPAQGKDRTILLLDDDTNTLLVLHTILERTAARILECANEPCAVQHCEAFSRSIDLLVADVVLQDSNGPAVARKVKQLQPDMRLLYISGFSLPELQRRGLLSSQQMSPGAVEFLQKPFSSEQFLNHVNKLLPN
ncbi:MAG TPA: response regulator [Bryobacteraceae bacterium]|nr:response regulator [Bryobacteraceae bacterium]